MEVFQKMTQYFQNVGSATWKLGRKLYDSMKDMLTEILNAWLTFFLALTGEDSETHLSNDEGFVQDAAPLLAEEIEVRILISSTAVREL